MWQKIVKKIFLTMMIFSLIELKLALQTFKGQFRPTRPNYKKFGVFFRKKQCNE